MIQIASVLAVASVIMDSNTLGREAGLICETKLYPCKDLSQNYRGGLYARGCIYNCGIVWHNLYRMGGDLFHEIFFSSYRWVGYSSLCVVFKLYPRLIVGRQPPTLACLL